MIQLLEVMQSSGGDICVPSEVVWAVIAGYAALGGAVGIQWRAKLESDRRIAKELEKAQDRLFEALKEKQQSRRSS